MPNSLFSVFSHGREYFLRSARQDRQYKTSSLQVTAKSWKMLGIGTRGVKKGWTLCKSNRRVTQPHLLTLLRGRALGGVRAIFDQPNCSTANPIRALEDQSGC
jgi:hypothetical protein